MATALQHPSSYDSNSVPDASMMRIGIVVSEWNKDITDALLEGACQTLEKHQVAAENRPVFRVPGSFELTFGAQQVAKHSNVDAVIILGCVIRGDTPHFDYVCQSVTQGVTSLNATLDIPVIFGLLTTDNWQQAKERAGGKFGNKGEEAAITAIKMIDFFCRIKK